MCKNKIAQEVRNADGTSDSEGNEIFAIIPRYVCKDDLQVKEHVIHIVEAKDRTAKGLMEIISKTLSEMGLSLDSVAAQCYDGASVMSGERGGLQTLFCAACGRYILYVHCYCHRLHLVVTDILDSLQDMKNHYSILSKLYNFF